MASQRVRSACLLHNFCLGLLHTGGGAALRPPDTDAQGTPRSLQGTHGVLFELSARGHAAVANASFISSHVASASQAVGAASSTYHSRATADDREVDLIALLVIAGISFVVWFSFMWFLSYSAKVAIAKFDESVIGVDTVIGSLHFSPCSGQIKLREVVINNPEGYHSEFLLKAELVKVSLNMRKLLGSFGKVMHIEALEVNNVTVIFERALTTSNVDDIVNVAHEKETAAAEMPVENSKEVYLRKVAVKGLQVKVTTHHTLRGQGPTVSVDDIHYGDFSKEFGEQSSVALAAYFAEMVLKTAAAAARTAVGDSVTGAVNVGATGAGAVVAGTGAVVAGVAGVVDMGASALTGAVGAGVAALSPRP